MRIGNEMKGTTQLLAMESDLYPERVAFWSDLKAHIPVDMLDESSTQKNVKGEL